MAADAFIMSRPDNSVPWPAWSEAGAGGGLPPGSEVSRLTQRMTRGDEEAYRTFHDRYCNRLFRYLLVITRGDDQAAQDALQETCIRVTRHVRVFKKEEVFWSWLTVLARSAARDGGRRQKRHWELLRRYAGFLFGQSASTESRISENSSQQELEMAQRTEQALDLLPPLDRALMRGKYLEKQSLKDLAARHRLTEKAVESRLLRARRQIKEVVLGQIRKINEVPS